VNACYSRDAERGAAFAAKNGISRCLTDRNEFLGDSEFETVYVASPNSLHFTWARDALLAGKRVVCEKPFTSNLAEFDALVSLAKERGLSLCEALTTVHLPNLQKIRDLLPQIMPVRSVLLNFSQFSSRYTRFLSGETPNVFNLAFSGGALMDLNYYNIGFMVDLFGKPTDIRYFANKAANGVDTSGLLVLTYPGFVASLTAAKDSGDVRFVLLQGEKGSVYCPSPASNLSAGLSLYERDNPETTKQVIQRTAEAPRETFQYQDETNVLYYEARDICALFDNDNFDVCNAACTKALERSRMEMEIADAARKSAGIVFPADKST
jgi:predicted dehydrogenase